uniref:Cartilage intermediate layer protein 1 n=1 Tax=Petromyzon marinus TaxID=7757 RepID=A0AAJ7WN57_PETMA|nr:cartilage intermediate layer protein 1 [Petromyzon marinus]XP_032803745.1 cartilage intermediate layer protein 1 [Petromyzon marinus]
MGGGRLLALVLALSLTCCFAQELTEWTAWFNIDHPGGNGDYERLEAIRYYYRGRVCARPLDVEARTTTWVPAEHTGEVVHFSPEQGFWCINKEQTPGSECSNYHVRFLCPVESVSRWTKWSGWSSCSASCGPDGVQTRRRECMPSTPDASCPGANVEERSCFPPPRTCILLRTRPAVKRGKGPPVKACALQCPEGRPDTSCRVCLCEGHTIYGRVAEDGGAPLAGATMRLTPPSAVQQLVPERALARTDHNGVFEMHGVCASNHTELGVHRDRFAPAVFRVQPKVRGKGILRATLQLAEKPQIVKHPESRARFEGQSVTFCCKATGHPLPTKYIWYHNGSMLQGGHKQDSSLVLSNLRLHQAGDYHCKAVSEVGAVKSFPAKLSLLPAKDPACNPTPTANLIRLPHDCFQNDSNSLYMDVGACPSKPCAGAADFGECGDPIKHCCGVARTEERDIACQGYKLTTMAVTECGCGKCVRPKVLVRGRAVAADNNEPLRFGQIYIGKNRVGFTGYKGTFSFPVPEETERLVVTFVDPSQKLVDSTKVLPFNKKGGTVFIEVKMLRKKPHVTLNPAVANIVPLGEAEGQDPIAEMEIPPNSFYLANGEVYSGFVKASVTFLDPRVIATSAAAPSDLNYIDTEGDIFPLRTYGMFSVDFKDEQLQETLNSGKVKIYIDSNQIKMPEHHNKMKLWSLNTETGLWEEEADFKYSESRRSKREERTFLIGNVEIRERRMFNLDVPEERRCYVKVRTYRSESFMQSEQVQGVVVSLINMEPKAGFASNPRAWGRFDSVVTGPNGACLPAFCDSLQPDAYTAYVTASLGAEELEAAPSSPKLNPNLVGVTRPFLDKLQYQRTDHEDSAVKKTAFKINLAKPDPNLPDETNGPIYAFVNLKECEQAPYSANHFRFYRVEGDRYEFNKIPFNENDLMSWTANYLSWWPKPQEFRACYVKVKINGPKEVMIRSSNVGGTHPATTGQLYGMRDVRSVKDMTYPNVSAACVEFKCGGMLYDESRIDRTLVTVVPQGDCQRQSVNAILQEYLANHPPLATNNASQAFTMFAPLDPLGHNYGIYTVTDQDPRTAKEIALGRCFDGTSDGASRVMKSDVGIGLMFACRERAVGRESLFERVRNSPPVVTRTQSSRVGVASGGRTRNGGLRRRGATVRGGRAFTRVREMQSGGTARASQ